MASRFDPNPAGSVWPPDDPPTPSPYIGTTNFLMRGGSLIALAIAILLCLAEMGIAFVTFMLLAIMLEVIDLLFGFREMRRLWGGVERYSRNWRAGYQTRLDELRRG